MFVYRVYNTVSTTYWTSPKGDTVWNSRLGGPTTYNYHRGRGRKHRNTPKPPTFDSQTRYIIHKFKLVKV